MKLAFIFVFLSIHNLYSIFKNKENSVFWLCLNNNFFYEISFVFFIFKLILKKTKEKKLIFRLQFVICRDKFHIFQVWNKKPLLRLSIVAMLWPNHLGILQIFPYIFP